MARRKDRMLRAAFTKYPIIMNSLVYGSLYVGAEFSQQTVRKKLLAETALPINKSHLVNYGVMGVICQQQQDGGQSAAYDADVIVRYGVLGVTLYPTIYYYWYRWLDRRFVGKSAEVIIKKLLLDQFVLTPPLLVIFFVGMSMMEGASDIWAECRNKGVYTFRTSCMFWLPAQTANFLLVPPAFRVVYVGSCAFLWVNILCIIKRQPH